MTGQLVTAYTEDFLALEEFHIDRDAGFVDAVEIGLQLLAEHAEFLEHAASLEVIAVALHHQDLARERVNRLAGV